MPRATQNAQSQTHIYNTTCILNNQHDPAII